MSKKPIQSLIFPATPAIVCTEMPSARGIAFHTGFMRPENDPAWNLDRTQDILRTGFRNRTE